MALSPSSEQLGSAMLRLVAGEAPRHVPTGSTWPDWIDFARRERVIPLLYRLVEDHGGDLDDEHRTELEDALIEVLSVALRHDRHLTELAELLSSIDVPFAALKGAAVANLDYPDPSWRQYGDLDILVDERHRSATCEALALIGWSEWYPMPAGHERFTHAITLTRGRGWEIDVHQRLAHRAIGRLIPVPDLFANRDPFEIAGTPVWALGVADRVIHAALHAALSHQASRRLSSVADVLLLATNEADRAPQIIARSDSWKVRSLVERSIRAAFAAADLALPQPWRSAMAAPVESRSRLIDIAYGADSRRPALEELAHLRLLPSWKDRWGYVSAFVFAGSDYAERKGRGPLAQVGYLIRRLRGQD